MRVRGVQGRCSRCGAWPLQREHRCASMFEVRVPGVTARSRRVLATSCEEAAVLIVDELEREGRFAIAAGCEHEVAVRRAGSRTWQGVMLSAVEVTNYYPTQVRALGSPSRRLF
jgi:hypothetical protein